MKVPLKIKNKMLLICSHVRKIESATQEINDWMERNGIDLDSLSDGSGTGFDEILYGNNVVEELCSKIEKLKTEKENEENA